MADCIFCKLVAGQIPCHKVTEDAQTLAFMDIGQVNPGHVLVAVKPHHATLTDMDEDLAAAVMRTVHRVAQTVKRELQPEGLTLLQANGAAGWQTVPHFHVHVLPRRHGDAPRLEWPPMNPPQEELAAMARRLRC